MFGRKDLTPIATNSLTYKVFSANASNRSSVIDRLKFKWKQIKNASGNRIFTNITLNTYTFILNIKNELCVSLLLKFLNILTLYIDIFENFKRQYLLRFPCLTFFFTFYMS